MPSGKKESGPPVPGICTGWVREGDQKGPLGQERGIIIITTVMNMGGIMSSKGLHMCRDAVLIRKPEEYIIWASFLRNTISGFMILDSY